MQEYRAQLQNAASRESVMNFLEELYRLDTSRSSRSAGVQQEAQQQQQPRLDKGKTRARSEDRDSGYASQTSPLWPSAKEQINRNTKRARSPASRDQQEHLHSLPPTKRARLGARNPANILSVAIADAYKSSLQAGESVGPSPSSSLLQPVKLLSGLNIRGCAAHSVQQDQSSSSSCDKPFEADSKPIPAPAEWNPRLLLDEYSFLQRFPSSLQPDITLSLEVERLALKEHLLYYPSREGLPILKPSVRMETYDSTSVDALRYLYRNKHYADEHFSAFMSVASDQVYGRYQELKKIAEFRNVMHILGGGAMVCLSRKIDQALEEMDCEETIPEKLRVLGVDYELYQELLDKLPDDPVDSVEVKQEPEEHSPFDIPYEVDNPASNYAIDKQMDPVEEEALEAWELEDDHSAGCDCGSSLEIFCKYGPPFGFNAAFATDVAAGWITPLKEGGFKINSQRGGR